MSLNIHHESATFSLISSVRIFKVFANEAGSEQRVQFSLSLEEEPKCTDQMAFILFKSFRIELRTLQEKTLIATVDIEIESLKIIH